MVNFCTIISGNYIAFANVLADSLFKNHKTALHVLIVDKKSTPLIENLKHARFRYIFVESLKINNFQKIAFKYNVTELCTAVKPFYLELFLKNKTSKVVYLDPDICVYSPLTEVLKKLNSYSIVLTPHSTSPILDGRRPSDIDFLRNGVFNLGFIGLSGGSNTIRFIKWWQSRCYNYGYADTTSGLFVDQKWIDLASCYFDSVYILKDPGYNVAYWNIHERHLSFKKNNLFCNGRKLAFFHFSGLLQNNSNRLSVHSTRSSLNNNKVLKKIVLKYRVDLKNATKNLCSLNYSYSFFSNNYFVPDYSRRFILPFYCKTKAPFNTNSQFYLEYCKLFKRNKLQNKVYNTLNFNPSLLKIRIFNCALIWFSKVAGVKNTFNMLHYCSFLARGSFFYELLANKPFSLEHRLKK